MPLFEPPFQGGITNQGNTAGTAGVVGGSLYFAGGNNVTLSQSVNGASATISVHGAAGGGGGVIDRQFHEILEGEFITNCASVTAGSFSNRPIMIPFWIDGGNLSAKTVRVFMSCVGGTPNFTMGAGFYSMANSTLLSLGASATQSYSAGGSATFSGVRAYQITGMSNFALTEGRWVLGLLMSGSAPAAVNFALQGGQTGLNIAGTVNPGVNQTVGTATSAHIVPWWGVYSVTSGGFPNSIARSQVAGGATAHQADVYAMIAEM
jgi:hypothetical protein